MKKITKKQIFARYVKLWKKTTRHDGYQPFGYDLPTMWAVHPAFMRAREKLKKMYLEAK